MKEAIRTLKNDKSGFSLVEVVIALVIFMFVFSGIYMVSSRAMLMLDSSRQSARATDITLANIEYLRTRAWDQLVYFTNTAPGQAISVSSNMIVSQLTPYMVCSYLELHPDDPLNIFLTAQTGQRPSRQIIMEYFPSGIPVTPGGSATNHVIKATVVTAWQNMSGTMMTNTMTTLISKGGLSANYLGLNEADVDFLNQLTAQ
ncbi:type IV pilus modification PilV family protein [Geitlerinema calcuttense]|uniref:Prepilin-type N-terminal cleavage/methylation domain-containing protein n=1 Tax=Geitlerinema calcuttense NRMC-F 0142 TaxID=2922238 RepID=A0ABT7M1V9_9CYAN|nr:MULTISPECIES: prepilin-type N-terminal cleavage/methylation domain-containing protein [Cyanophyceae]MDL5055606.1 prepilin-type N-terminal cleavage/methylation domain-containing protein [Oscillatoria laete-virens NRMC-F 0139]MDL5057827.1 prepilin-type N-terminal cleavage/methylation domain-containing protein [Geitlerinema calcuttense NRMC-F 0142]